MLLSISISIAFVVPSGTTSSSFLGHRTRMVYHSSPVIVRRNGGTSTGMNMMFDQLSGAIQNIAQNLGGKKKMTEKGITRALKDVRRALLDADVNVNVADTLIEGVKKRAVGTELIKGVTPDQQFVKIMYDELLDLMGGDSTDADGNNAAKMGNSPPVATLARSSEGPAVVLLAGLQGAGKTTAAGKLALYLKEREVDYEKVTAMGEEAKELVTSRMPKTERKVLLAAADVYRPAAIKQLEILGESIGVEVFSMGTDADPAEIARLALEKAINEGFDTLIVDTAGRQVVDADLMDELRRMKSAVNPSETLLVVDAMTGQEAASLTAAFDEAVGITGAILTKLDGDSRGGAAVSVRGVSGKPIKFVGTGEKTPDLEPFYPDRMASRILGQGDVISLVEKAAALSSDAEAEEMAKKMLEAKFDFEDFLKQSEMMSQMGSMASVAKMMPGMAGMMDDNQMSAAEKRLKKSKSLILSMTKKERQNPDMFIKDKTGPSRVRRVSKGAGMNVKDGEQFIQEFQTMRTMMSRMQKKMQAANDNGQDPSEMTPEDQIMASGNRAQRRAMKKKKKKQGGSKRGFG